MDLKLAPSILSADFKHINQEMSQVEACADLFHIDIMDGKFVPPTTIDSDFVKTFETQKPLDVHLMVQEPTNEFLQGFIDAGASSITVHVEACTDPNTQLHYIKSKGVKACIALKPNTPVEDIKPYLDSVDMVLVMTVEPGWGGQAFMADMMDKIKEIRSHNPEIDIEVDGGIDKNTAPLAKQAGANVFVAGSAIFKTKDRKQACEDILKSLK